MFTHSRRQNCPAYIYVATALKKSVSEIEQQILTHNHALTEESWKYLLGNRRLNEKEVARVIPLHFPHVPSEAFGSE